MGALHMLPVVLALMAVGLLIFSRECIVTTYRDSGVIAATLMLLVFSLGELVCLMSAVAAMQI